MTADTKIEENAFFRKRIEELGLAFGLLTRLPLPAFARRSNATLGTAFWAYPLAGMVIGLCAGAAFWLATAAGFSTAICALIAIVVSLLAGGGFHEDGLSDFWDGLGGGGTREAKLSIMRDSRIGTYGALALFFTLGLQTAFLINLHHYAGEITVILALIAAETAARGAIAFPLAALAPARSDGLGSLMTKMRPETFMIGLGIAAAAPIGFLGFHGGLLFAGAALGAGFITLLARHYLGGFTGDVLGASAATARMTGLSFLVLLVTP